MEIDSEIGKPSYVSDMREWKGRPVDLGLYWLERSKGFALHSLCSPHFIVPQDLPKEEYKEFLSWARAELVKKHGVVE